MEVQVADYGVTVEVPDDATEDEIIEFLNREYPAKGTQQTEPQEVQQQDQQQVEPSEQSGGLYPVGDERWKQEVNLYDDFFVPSVRHFNNKNLRATLFKTLGGLVEDATLGIYSPERGQIEYPFTDKPIFKVGEGLNEFYSKEGDDSFLGLKRHADQEVIDNEYLKVAGGVIAPAGLAGKLGNGVEKVTGLLVKNYQLGRKAQLAKKVVDHGATGAIIGGAFGDGENTGELATFGGLLSAGVPIAGVMFSQMVKLGKYTYGSVNELRDFIEEQLLAEFKRVGHDLSKEERHAVNLTAFETADKLLKDHGASLEGIERAGREASAKVVKHTEEAQEAVKRFDKINEVDQQVVKRYDSQLGEVIPDKPGSYSGRTKVRLSEEKVKSLVAELRAATHKTTEDYNDITLIENLRHIKDPEDFEVLAKAWEKEMGDTDAAARGKETLEGWQRQVDKSIDNFEKFSGIDMSELRADRAAAERLKKRMQLYKAYMISAKAELQELAVKSEGNPILELELLRKVQKYNDFKHEFLGMRADTARATAIQQTKIGVNEKLGKNFFEDLAENLEDTPLNRLRAKQELQRLGGEEGVAALRRKFKEAKSVADITKVAHMKGSWWDVVAEQSVTSMLSSVGTQSVNVGSNLARVYADLARDSVAWVAGGLLRLDTRITTSELGKRWYITNSVLLKESLKALAGVPKGLWMLKNPKAFEDWLKKDVLDPTVVREGYTNKYISKEFLQAKMGERLGKIMDMPLIGVAVDQFGALQRGLSYGIMQRTDDIFARVAYEAELQGTLARMGAGKEDSVKWIDSLYKDIKKFRKGEKLTDISPEHAALIMKLDKQALEYSREARWQGEIETDFFKKAEQFATTPFMRATFTPFFRTPAQLIKFAHEGSVTGLLSKKVRDDLLGRNGDIAKARRIGQMAVVNFLLYQGVNLALEGKITGRFTPQERDTMLAAGIQSNAINFGTDEEPYFVQLDRGDPWGMIMTIAADLTYRAKEMNEENYQKLVAESVFTLLDTPISKTWAKGIGDLVLILKDSENIGKRTTNYLINQTSKFNPLGGLFGSLTDADRKTIKEVNSWWDKTRKTYGLDDESLTDDVDILGKVSEREVLHWAFPLRVSRGVDPQEHPARYLMAKLGMEVRKPQDYIEGIQLTPEEYFEYQRMVDTEFHLEDILNDIATSPLPERLKAEKMQEKITKIRDKARRLFMAENEGFIERVAKLKEKNLNKRTENMGVETSDFNMSDFMHSRLTVPYDKKERNEKKVLW